MTKKLAIYVWLVFLCLGSFAACGKEEKILLSEESRTAEEVQDSGEEAGKAEEEPQEKLQAETEAPREDICVYLCGAVKNPGVYFLSEGARLYEAIEAAGGFADNADESWWNQAAQLEDGVRVEIYTQEETKLLREQGAEPESPGSALEGSQKGGSSKEENQNLVNINTASTEELQTIPGIGQVKAEAIAAYREENGPFSSVEQIQEVPGIKGKTYDKIKSYISY